VKRAGALEGAPLDGGLGRRILVIGADLIMPKLFYFARSLRELGYDYVAYTHDNSAQAARYLHAAGVSAVHGPPHSRSPMRLFRDVKTLVRSVRARDYHHADLYSDYHMLASLLYLLVLKTKRIPVVLWCRGELYDWAVFKWWQGLYFHVAIALADTVVLKERYMAPTLAGAGLYRPHKMIEIHNSVPMPRWRRTEPFSRPRLNLLFMNMFKAWRTVSYFAEVAVELQRRGVDFHMAIVGEKTDSPGLVAEADKLRRRIADLGVGDLVSVHPFTPEPTEHFKEADVFLLSGNVIYCNYALLEAMSYGLVPLVDSSDDGYRLIIDDGVSGFGLPLVAERWADTIKALADDRAAAARMAEAAWHRADERFSTRSMFARYVGATRLDGTARDARAAV
jgi:glycosyltransferase involved in cell wall biosynthesis